MWQTKPYRTSVALQALIETAARTADAKELAMLSKAYACLEMLKLRLRMKPAPKPVEVGLSPGRKPKPGNVISFTEHGPAPESKPDSKTDTNSDT